MKKKVSVALVLALTMLLIAACALAAVLLSGRGFVDAVMAPAAMENSADTWTAQEVAELLRIGGEHGLVLDEHVIGQLAEKDSVYKEEMMRLFVKLDLGFYPSTWPIEDQAWYEQMQVETGLKTPDEVARFLPEEGELTQEQAVSIAQETIHAQYDPEADLEDGAIYLRHLTYQNLLDSGGREGRGWYVEYQALDLYHDGYVVHIWPDGTVFDPMVFPGIGEERPAEPKALENRYIDVYGMWYGWDMATWIAFSADLQQAFAAHPGVQADPSLVAMGMQAYGLPDARAIERSGAIDMAIDAVLAEAEVPAETLLASGAYAVYLLGEDVPVWKATVPHREMGNWTVEINAYTGEVRRIDFIEPGTPIRLCFVLQSVFDQVPPRTTQSVG